ncbi:MAG: type II toxin-antitoxin system ParD family antitoxin [Azospirillaceae bacterium]|nr:type II toxin-antitoxin system ParD family antitoxin [Azospirillaceae bacterium]
MPRRFVLGDRFEAFIDTQVKTGRYNSAREVVREGLRPLEDDELTLRSRTDERRALVDEGLSSGVSTSDGTEFLGRLKTKYASKPKPTQA